MKAYLLLEDGSIYTGISMGKCGTAIGEVVFNTGMTGYQEVLTDPSYYGQIVTMTYPLIGNYGINNEDFQSTKPQVRGFIVRESCEIPDNFRAQYNLDEYLKMNEIVGIEGIDTRALTKILREKGTMKGMITDNLIDLDYKKCLINQYNESDHVRNVMTKKIYHIPAKGPKIAVIDYGTKKNILENLKIRNADITVFPSTTTYKQILQMNPDGVLLSNGPGDPKDVDYGIETVKNLIGKLPIFGICLGHQILALAFGGDTCKLKYGHRGSNHPVKDLKSGRTFITAQNHGYTVIPESLPEDVEITHININDGTVEGIRHKKLPVFSVQFHPEASPGPNDMLFLFDEFIKMVKEGISCIKR
ncbi:glutamine-hydrolyzing carbamoyl-phosphate synthase small subunit [Aceticella autotrophica]|uniref:Carbamoyl phosphate synthase small chain n=1 Tax=Aceticella autotrophica TaxID=2755338 RepID=A0A975GAD9_9THEO|nr:carbamoyl phosphate synthase small subunit [Aceticella autotrophica]QSZ27012.1 glutamine-hydrolyzing carbamoyl-phosphate synthase small subunit [Aceticella autotrophica]